MITNSKQNWEVGQKVNVGFIGNLTVVAKIPTPNDGEPDAYVLVRGTQFYRFVPHNGISRCTQATALGLIADAERHQQKAEMAKAAQAEKQREVSALLARCGISVFNDDGQIDDDTGKLWDAAWSLAAEKADGKKS